MNSLLFKRPIAGLVILLAGLLTVPAEAEPEKKTTILILSTGANRMTNGAPTGLWLEEFAVPYNAFIKAGFEVIVATPKGGIAPVDPKSNANPAQASTWADPIKRLNETLPLSSIDPAQLDAVFIPGGHGAMFDLADDPQTAKLLAELDAKGKIIAAVCHGPAAFVGVTRADGKPLVAGKTIAPFTNEEERGTNLDKAMPFLLETKLKEQGATIQSAPKYQPKALRDQNLITGQNPASSQAVANLVIEALHSKTNP